MGRILAQAILLAVAVTASPSTELQPEARSERCYHKYVTVSVVKQVPSYSKHCTKVDDTKCKTVFKNAFTTQMETQCSPTFDTSCEPTLETAYRQQCKTIKDIECRIVNIEKYGKHHQKKICNEVPVQKCVPVPVKVEGQKCVNVPTQTCETVPVVASVPVPQKQCYKKPRKVCQTLVTTKPKVVTEQVPHEVCGSSFSLAAQPPSTRGQKSPRQTTGRPARNNKDGSSLASSGGGGPPRLRLAESEEVPVYSEADMGYKKEDIPLYEEEEYRPYREEEEKEGEYRTYRKEGEGEYGHYGEEEEMEGYGSNTVQEEVDYHTYREREEARAEDLHNYYKQLSGQQGGPGSFFSEPGRLPFYDQVDRSFTGHHFEQGFEEGVENMIGRVQQQVEWGSLSSSPSNRLETVVGVEESGRPFIAGDIADTSQAFQANLGGEEATVEIVEN